ncbi:MAG: cell division protein FtsQ/DivIB [Lachnospiraceae bacterium]|nr:cell division protein FtsQ/DivIB [Lachnospiraceae bacterium]
MMSEKKHKRKKKKKPETVIRRPRLDIRGFMERHRPGKHAVHVTIFATAFVLILAFLFTYFWEKYRVDTIIVEGSTHYSNDEICDMVLGDGALSHNSIYLSIKYHDKEIKDVPFVETMSVRIMSPDSIRITVYEKAMAGFVEYMGKYIYFDKDGTVIESSNVKTVGIPQIMGMKFDHIVLYEKLPVDDEKIFKQILDVSQLLDKYEISVDKIYFDQDYNLTLYFGEARVKLGSFDEIDEKIIRLKNILPELQGKKGVLRMENYTSDDVITTFEYDE